MTLQKNHELSLGPYKWMKKKKEKEKKGFGIINDMEAHNIILPTILLILGNPGPLFYKNIKSCPMELKLPFG